MAPAEAGRRSFFGKGLLARSRGGAGTSYESHTIAVPGVGTTPAGTVSYVVIDRSRYPVQGDGSPDVPAVVEDFTRRRAQVTVGKPVEMPPPEPFARTAEVPPAPLPTEQAGKAVEDASKQVEMPLIRPAEGPAGPPVSESTPVSPDRLPAAPGLDQGSALPPAAKPRLCKSKRLVINYDVTDVGPSGVSSVELWYTRDSQKWHKLNLVAHTKGPCVVEVAGEGLYGFTVLARNGDGRGKEAPHPGDQPQIWTEVDTTRPAVQLVGAETAPDRPDVTITWKADDKNLGAKPITLAYAERANGPWTTFAAGVENTGRYEWRRPANLAGRLFLRVEAVDQVGNVGADQTTRPVLADCTQPSAAIVAVEADDGTVPPPPRSVGRFQTSATGVVPTGHFSATAVYPTGQPGAR
jgi:hypothetical protein